jgi:hypothetical protein
MNFMIGMAVHRNRTRSEENLYPTLKKDCIQPVRLSNFDEFGGGESIIDGKGEINPDGVPT